MKNIINKIVFYCAGLCVFTACNDDSFLNEKTEDFITVDNAYLNAEQFRTGIGQMYRQVRSLYNSGDNRNDWVLMGVGMDVFTTSTVDDNASQPEFNDWRKINSQNGVANKWWKFGYDVIKNCNELLFQTNNANVKWGKVGEKEEIQAEIRFFRAFAYRCLANIFGGVPILENPIDHPTLNFVRATRKDVYEFAIEDAIFASKNLPIKIKKDGQVVRATADHLLSELYIALSDNGGEKSYDKAIDAATRVIDGTDGSYGLMRERFGRRMNETDKGKDVYWDLFRMGNQNYLEAGNIECLWAIQFEYNTPGGTNTFDRPLFERHFWPNFWQKSKFGYNGVARDNTGRGVAYVRPADYIIYGIWNKCGGDTRNSEANIIRKHYAPYVIKNGVEVPDYDTIYSTPVEIDGSIIDVKIKPGEEIKKEWLTSANDTMSSYFPRFFKFGTDKHINGIPDNGFVPDWYVFRVAETYLLRAEAYMKEGNLAAAVDDINKVRSRVNARLIDVSELDIDFLLDERTRELLGEEQRFMTLSRMGKVYERTKKYGRNHSAATIQEYNNLLPIPQSAIDANLEAELKQNPGY